MNGCNMSTFVKFVFLTTLCLNSTYASLENLESKSHRSVFQLYHHEKDAHYEVGHFTGSAVIVQGPSPHSLFALTNAHCILTNYKPNDIWSLRQNRIRLIVSKVFIHPAYNQNEVPHDIALLKLEDTYHKLRPAHIPQNPAIFFDRPIRSYGFALEMGRSGFQIPVEQSIINRYYSAKYYGPAQDHVYGPTLNAFFNYKYQTTQNACKNLLSSFNTVRIVKSGENYVFMPDERQLGVTIPGMSGGGAFDSTGNLVAINCCENLYYADFSETWTLIYECLTRAVTRKEGEPKPSRGSSLLDLAPYRDWISTTMADALKKVS